MNYLKNILLLVLVLTSALSWAQNQSNSGILVKGTVYNEVTKLPIASATVVCGDFASTFTNDDGTFSIEVRSANDILNVKAEGFQNKDVLLTKVENVNIYLTKEQTKTFQQNMYNGYTKTKQLYTTQAVSTVDWNLRDIAKVDGSSGENAMDGKIAGLDARARNGIKGAGSDIFIRGYSSLYANNQPLIIVDGMIYDTESYGTSLINGFRSNPLGGIDVGDIENITVIRDAASIYGAKASNGVIFIRTGHATKQATSIDFSVNGTMEMAPDNIPMLGAEDYRLYLNEILLSGGITADSISKMPFQIQSPDVLGYYTYHNNTDWQKKVFSDNYSQNYRLKIKGGDDVALYALSLGFLNQKGTVNGSDNSRFNFRFNSDINFSKNVTLNSNISFHYITKNISGTGVESFYDPVYASRIKAPFLQEYEQNESGIASPELIDSDFLSVSNPVALVKNTMQKDVNYRLFGSFNFNWKLTKNFTLSNLIGLSFDKSRQSIFIPDQGVPADSSEYGLITNQMKANIIRHFVVNNDFRATYNETFNVEHRLNAMVGVRANMNTVEQDWAADYNSANDQIRSLSNGNYLLRQKGGVIGDWSNAALYATADYSFKNRYLATFNVAFDGSSRNGIDANGIKMFKTRFGVYPGAAVAWIASSESFLSNINALNLLKVRASYGLTGNDDIGNYTSKKYYVEKNLLSFQGIVNGNLWNPALGPEKTTKMNIGVDAALFNDRINLSADVFQNKTTDLFDYIDANIYSGYDGYYGNLGGFTTSGFDIAFDTRIINGEKLKWNLGLILSKYSTKVDELFDNSRTEEIFGATIITKEGSPIGQFYGYETNGVYSSDADAATDGLLNRMNNEDLVAFGGGDVRFIDQNSDGIIDTEDMTVIGDPTPDFTGEVYSSIKYKGLTLEASLGFSYGNEVFNYQRYTLENLSSTNNQTATAINRWRYQGQVTDVPKAILGDPMNNSRFSDRWIEDGSYARLKSVTLSYMLPVNTNVVKYIELYATGYNLLTFTNYLGQDPEFSFNSNALSQGIDIGMVPQNKMVMLGIRIGL